MAKPQKPPRSKTPDVSLVEGGHVEDRPVQAGSSESDASQAWDDDMPVNPRTCIVTRQQRDADELIRFVLSPDGEVVADLAHKLPGRGVWVSANTQTMAQAVKRRLFAKAFRAEVKVDPALAENLEAQLEARALSALSMARKAGLVRTGSMKIEADLRARKAAILLHATDAAPDGIRKLAQAAHASGAAPETLQLFSRDALDNALGSDNCVHAALVAGGATKAFRHWAGRLAAYRAESEGAK